MSESSYLGPRKFNPIAGNNISLEGTYPDITFNATGSGGGGGTAGVSKVNGRDGDVTLTKSDVGLDNVNNTSDANKPVSTAQAAANADDRLRSNHTGTQAASTITGLATVATSGSYNDLSDKPAISGGGGTNEVIQVARGINVAGGEFAHTAATLPGTYGTDYSYDSPQAFANLAAKGHKVVRLPFRWERVQPTLGGPLNTAEINRIKAVVDSANAVGIKVILDLHNYARYIDSSVNGGAERLLDTVQLPISSLTDVWVKLSGAFKNNSGVYAYDIMNEPYDLLPRNGSFAGTTRYDFSDGAQGWTGEGATTSVVSGKLRVTKSFSSSAGNIRAGDNGTKRGGVLTGNYLQAVVTLDPTMTSGTHTARLQWQNSSFQYQNAASTTYVRTDTGATVLSLVPGVPVLVTANFSSNPITNPNAFAAQLDVNSNQTGTFYFDVDEFKQGGVTGAVAAPQVWEDASQQVLTAIRGNEDKTKVYIPGYQYSGAQNWVTNHPTPWITDSANNFAYQAHHYWDSNNSGTYTSSYAQTNTDAVNAGYANLTARITTEINRFLNWLQTNNVKGLVGELGWPNTGDTTSWNTLANAYYNLLDTAGVDATYWATGARWGNDYLLSAYTGTDLQTSRTQAATIEAHPSVVFTLSNVVTKLDTKQDKLVSGTNIKTVNGNSLLGPGNVAIDTTAYLKKDGTDTMTGSLQMGANKITNVATGTVDTDGVNKLQMDTADATKVSKAGDTMTGNLTMTNSHVNLDTGRTIRFQGTNDNWRIGRSVIAATNAVLTSNRLQIITTAGVGEGAMFMTSAGLPMLEVGAPTTSNAFQANLHGSLVVDSTSTLTGAVTATTLNGTGTRMVVADGNGLLGTQAIPSGGGSGGGDAYLANTQTFTGANTFSGGVTTASLSMPAGTITTDSTTGLKIGAASDKVAFFNGTPVARQSATQDLGTTLSALNLRTAGSAYPITTSGTLTLTGAVNASGTNTFSSGTSSFTATTNISGAVTNITTPVTQTHTFAVGDIIRRSSGNYVKAIADGSTNGAAGLYIVSGVTGGTAFTYKQMGQPVYGLTGLTDGALYYLSPTTAGAMTTTAPTVAGQVAAPIFVATSATTGTFGNYLTAAVGAGAATTASLAPTFGVSSATSNAALSQTNWFGLFVANSTGSITKLTTYAPYIVAGSVIEMGVYSMAGALLASGTVTTTATPGLLTVTLSTSVAVTAGTSYYYSLLNRTAETTTQFLAQSNVNLLALASNTTGTTTMPATMPSSGRNATNLNFYIQAS